MRRGSSPRVMKTRRERRSSSGQAERWVGTWTSCCTPWIATGVSDPSTLSSPLTRRIRVAVPVEQHGQPEAEQGPVERPLDDERKGGDRIRHGLSPACIGVRRSRCSADPPWSAERAAARPGCVGVERARARRRISGASGLRARKAATTASAVRGRAEIGLGQHQPVGDGGLLDAFGLARQLVAAVDGIDGGDHRAHAEVMLQHRIGRDGGDHRQRVGEAGRSRSRCRRNGGTSPRARGSAAP